MATGEGTDDAARTAQLEAVLRGMALGLSATYGELANTGDPLLHPGGPAPRHEVAILVGFWGQPAGAIQLGMTREFALAWARAATGQVPESLEKAAEALLDASGVLLGAVANELARLGHLVRFTEPAIALDREHRPPWPHYYVQEIPLTLDAHELKLAVGLEARAGAWPMLRFPPLLTGEPADEHGWLTRLIPAAG